MLQRKSVGAVVFKSEPRQYLLLHYEAGHWDFPKGGVEAGEKEEDTLAREMREETGITDYSLTQGFKDEMSYFFREGGELVRKTVVFYLAETMQEQVKLSFEHQDFAWLPFEEAKEKLTFKTAKELLEKAEAFLNKPNK